MQQVADFRSDTVTRPTDAMRQAMSHARVGDDVFGDDPTVKELEAFASSLLGKEAALYCPSGTMANQIAARVHCQPGAEVLLHRDSHMYRYEQGGLAALHGIQAVPLSGEQGVLDREELDVHLRGDDDHLPVTSLVALENTHNMAGGAVYPQERVEEVSSWAAARGLPLHLDGARLANAAVAQGRSLRELAAPGTSVTLCLSKGLGAPIGTMLAGSGPFIRRARRVRKLLGGGMRQVGCLAAAGLLALEHGIERLKEDHDRATAFANELTSLPGLSVITPETNIVVITTDDADPGELLRSLAQEHVLAVPFGAGRIRFTFHRDVGDDETHRALQAIRKHWTH